MVIISKTYKNFSEVETDHEKPTNQPFHTATRAKRENLNGMETFPIRKL